MGRPRIYAEPDAAELLARIAECIREDGDTIQTEIDALPGNWAECRLLDRLERDGLLDGWTRADVSRWAGRPLNRSESQVWQRTVRDMAAAELIEFTTRRMIRLTADGRALLTKEPAA